MFELIRQLVNLYGATGREAGVADAVEALVKDHVDSIRRDALGNLICEKRGTDPDGKRIMLSAHMDHIGFIVVAVEKEGFLRVMPVGGVGLAVSRTRHVSFQNGVQGVIAGTVSIPCRYVHSACEVIDLRDVEAARGLLLEYLK